MAWILQQRRETGSTARQESLQRVRGKRKKREGYTMENEKICMYKGSDGRKYSVQEAAYIAEGRHSYFACYYHQDRLYDFLCWTRLHLYPFYSREDAEKYLHEYAIRNRIELKGV